MEKPVAFFIFLLILTVVLGSFATNIEFSSDMMEQLPDDIDSMEAMDILYEDVGGSDRLLVLYELDLSEEGKPRDIRNNEVVETVYFLHSRLEDEPVIEEVKSVAQVFGDGDIPDNKEGVKNILSEVEGIEGFFNRQYTATLIEISANVPNDESSIESFTDDIEEHIDYVSGPSNLKGTVTGNAPIRVELFQFLQEDLLFTTGLAAVLIFIFIAILKRSLKWALPIFLPLLFGLSWTVGIITIIGIEITIATVFIGAMLLGMGVEYGAFLVERYTEEKPEKPTSKSVAEAVKNSVPFVGASITGSATTATAGFLTLLIATFPMIQDLGITLAVGIMNSLLSVLFIAPLLIYFIEFFTIKISGGDFHV